MIKSSYLVYRVEHLPGSYFVPISQNNFLRKIKGNALHAVTLWTISPASFLAKPRNGTPKTIWTFLSKKFYEWTLDEHITSKIATASSMLP